ncbi:MAG: RNA methyltransferase [Thermoplasmata archaeon]|nr:RNA methyltransferase [Thermoplasmata archaeon]
MRPELEVVLVRPKEDGNVGAVARLARNFGADRLVLVAPRARIGSEAKRRAMAGLPFLTGARRVATLEQAVGSADLVVGTTDLVTGRSTAYLRRSIPPERLAEMIRTWVGRVALVFGPEDNGLKVAELERCDVLVHIASRREFPTLNLSHAAAIVLYAIHRGRGEGDPESTPAPEVVALDGRAKEIFLARLGALLARTGYPAHKRRGMLLMFRRVLGRASPGASEYRMMLGLWKSIERKLGRARGG